MSLNWKINYSTNLIKFINNLGKWKLFINELPKIPVPKIVAMVTKSEIVKL